MPKIRFNRTSPEERAVTIRKFRSSGLSQKVFCENEGISLSTFQRWLKTGSDSAGFAEIVPQRALSTTVELVFPDGTALRIRGE